MLELLELVLLPFVKISTGALSLMAAASIKFIAAIVLYCNWAYVLIGCCTTASAASLRVARGLTSLSALSALAYLNPVATMNRSLKAVDPSVVSSKIAGDESAFRQDPV